jgi:hypothetical protein
MRILHLLRTEPCTTVVKLIECFSDEEENAVEPLYQGDVDWERLVDDIFSYDRVICWW